MSDPDLLIRTAGEMRISNFLLWQISYTELWVTPTLWPDFREDDLLQACRAYAGRERKFGGLPGYSGSGDPFRVECCSIEGPPGAGALACHAHDLVPRLSHGNRRATHAWHPTPEWIHPDRADTRGPVPG